MTHKFSRNLLCLAWVSAWVSAWAGGVFAGPAGPVVGVGSAGYSAATQTVTSATARTHIGWQSFNVAAKEVLRFVQPSAQSSVLNHIVNPRSFSLLGGVSSNGSVLFLSDGVVTGSGMNLDLAGVIDRSLRLPRQSLARNSLDRPAQGKPLATLAEGSIFVLGEDARAVAETNGEWMLKPGETVELADRSTPNLRVALTAPESVAINLSRLVAGKGTGIFAGLFRAPASARQAAERETESVQTAFMEDRVSDAPEVERFFRFARLYAEFRSDALKHEGGLVKTAAVREAAVVVALKSRPSLLPQEIELGASPARLSESVAGRTAMSQPVVAEQAATLEPQPILVAMQSEQEASGGVVLAQVSRLPMIEPVATLEPQPVYAAFESEMERNGVPIFARAALVSAPEVLATLEPQSVAVRQTAEPDDVRTLAAQTMPTMAPPERLQLAAAETDTGQVRRERRAGAAVIVVARAQQSGMLAVEEGSNVKELRIERSAPRYFRDYRGGVFFM